MRREDIGYRTRLIGLVMSHSFCYGADTLFRKWFFCAWEVESIGDSPSGKAPAFGAGIRGFESLIPSQTVLTCRVFHSLGEYCFLIHSNNTLWILKVL